MIVTYLAIAQQCYILAPEAENIAVFTARPEYYRTSVVMRF
jgi:hypothetical protein